jgi:hypothetical protein
MKLPTLLTLPAAAETLGLSVADLRARIEAGQRTASP